MEKIRKIGNLYLNHRFICNLIFLSILYFAHCFWGNMMYVAFPILAVMVILDNLTNGLSYLVFSIPFCFLNIYLSPILFLSCCVIYIIKFYCIKFFKDKSKPNWIVAISVLAFITYSLMPIGEYNTNLVIKLFGLLSLFVLLCVATQKLDILRFHFNIKLLCTSIIIASIFSMSYFISPYLKSYLIIEGVNDNLPRFMALFYHTNVLAMFCEIMLSVLAYYIVKRKFTKIDLFLFGTIAFIGVFTFSKTFFAIVCLILLILLIWRFCVDFKRTLIYVVPVLIVVVALNFIFPQLFIVIKDRFFGGLEDCKNFQDFMNMVTTNRYSLWVEYCTYIAQHPLTLFFGRGLGAPKLSTFSTHNVYISVIYQLGLVGTILMIIPLFFIIKNHLKNLNRKPHWAVFIPILVVCLILCFEDMIFYMFD